MSKTMQVIAICQEMGYTYQEFLEQPVWFIDQLKDKLEIDSDNIRKTQRKIRR